MTEAVSESRSESGVTDSGDAVASAPTGLAPEQAGDELNDPTAPQPDSEIANLASTDEFQEIPDPDSPAESKAADEQQGIMNEVRQRTAKRRRRRGVPPGWTIWLAAQSAKGRTFFSHQLPAWMMSHREQLISYLTSFAVLSFICMLMALWVMPPINSEELFAIIAAPADPAPEVAIGCKQNRLILGNGLHHRHGVAAGADQITLGFDRR